MLDRLCSIRKRNAQPHPRDQTSTTSIKCRHHWIQRDVEGKEKLCSAVPNTSWLLEGKPVFHFPGSSLIPMQDLLLKFRLVSLFRHEIFMRLLHCGQELLVGSSGTCRVSAHLIHTQSRCSLGKTLHWFLNGV